MCQEKEYDVYEKELRQCYAEMERLKTRIALLEEQKRLAKFQKLERDDKMNIVLNG